MCEVKEGPVPAGSNNTGPLRQPDYASRNGGAGRPASHPVRVGILVRQLVDSLQANLTKP